MSARQEFSDRMRARLDELRAEVRQFEHKVGQAETGLELEYYTRLEELKVKLEAAEQKFELFRETHDDAWETLKDDLEQSWKSMRDIINAITGP